MANRIIDHAEDNKSINHVISVKISRAILAGFESMFADFLNITLAAQSRFERAAWHEVQDAMKLRLKIYENKVENTAHAIKSIAYEEYMETSLWHEAKHQFATLIINHENALIGQTFFNSVFGSIKGDENKRDVHLFILQEQFKPKTRSTNEILCHLDSATGVISALEQLLNYFKFRIPFEDIQRDISSINQILRKFDGDMLSIENCHIEFAKSLFFRNKATYIIGRIIDDDDNRCVPFALPILNNDNGELFVDAFIIGEGQLSMLFGFARAYFMVDTDQPVRYVDYLCQLLPRKQRFELFNAIGFIKHAKTEFYRYKVDSTKDMPTGEKYISAPGIKGMVMLVFTTQNSEYVYKIIKDTFTPPKNITRKGVMEKYDFVKNADRIGRLVDTQEFRYLAFDLSRFSQEILIELKQKAGNNIIISGNALILKHVYVERKMLPLNLFVKQSDDIELKNVMFEYGNAIKQLAAANIFPGDMLMKNFGVTRWGRVVFYDYDEICPLLECHFKSIPQADNTFDELSNEPWFDIEPNDVFPEQFSIFLSSNLKAKKYFEFYHSDLFDAVYWQKLQKSIQDGEIADVFPYKDKWRFNRN
ncbi:bifunctional isocitrate dehydrogenase kinase/phosphatase [Pseudoalteromonas denitrificans]|uniref:Isocitrate dehydrogenase kinase/phosphatase n=1 Tax=Pseudoalteromonas denitrificans DSM 6059 TaxID=1123010 RepID=A0A1I1GD94_9GAMM|nr:bifunctional isocitrate dehydrogenase kinase/phosphatase [Pseudoalteromonas denitrificans]SFC07838.1 isocitrate dehydrogenase kinase/phosphatase [Pseudoalteromonas denitrificans DSM 6059]